MAAGLNNTLRRIPVWLVYVLLMLPGPLLFYWALTGALGVEPIKRLEHEYGLLGLQFLIAGLAISPLRRHLGVNLLRFRRAVGLVTFYYITLHLCVWLFLDVQFLSQVWADIVKRPYITIGMVGFLLMLPLAVTSNNFSVRKLGRAWHRLHTLVYGAAILGGLHFVMLVKANQIEPYIYLALVIGLLGLRLRLPQRARTKQPT